MPLLLVAQRNQSAENQKSTLVFPRSLTGTHCLQRELTQPSCSQSPEKCPNLRPIVVQPTTPVPRHPLCVKSVSAQVRPTMLALFLPRLTDRTTHNRSLHVRVQSHSAVRLAPVAHGTARRSASPCEIKGGRQAIRRRPGGVQEQVRVVPSSFLFVRSRGF